MTESRTSSLTPLRVLVVENDPQWRQDHVRNLKDWGYAPYAAEPSPDAPDPFQSLWENAIAKARLHRCHIALVDMRLRDDDDSGDITGLKLVPELAPTVSIIVSGYGDRKTVREALKSPPDVPERAHDFVAKEDGPNALKQVIKEMEQLYWRWQKVEIQWPTGLSPAHLVAQLYPGDQDVPVDQVEAVLGLLFREARRIILEEFDHPDHSQTEARAARCTGLLLQAYEGDNPRPVLAKLGTSNCVCKEAKHYQEYVAREDVLRLPLLGYYVLWDVGGLVYDLSAVSIPFETLLSRLGRLSGEGSTEEVHDLLRAVVTTLKAWQEEKPSLDKSLFDSYLGCYDQELMRLAQSDQSLMSLAQNVELPAPIEWVLEHRMRIPSSGLRAAVVHGQLRADSVLVDDDRRVFLINFEEMGYGYVLQDIALLEADLLIRMTSELDYDLFLELAVVIAQSETDPRRVRSTLRVDNNPRAQEVWQAIRNLRGEAFEEIWSPSAQEYLWALLLATLQRMVELGRDHPGYERAQLLGSVLCERLANWEESWPTQSLQHVELLTMAQLDDKRYEIAKLRQEYRLLLAAKESYGEKASQETRRSILRVEKELRDLGLTP